MTPRLLVVAGPTASGKSGLALAAAEAFDGVVINADSMQIYRELPILSAAPSADDMVRAPHRLYGVLSAAEICSAGRWREMALAEVAAAWAVAKLPIITGGTGLYINALLDGLSPIPDVPAEIRAGTRAHFAKLGNTAFHAALAARDPVMAARLDAGNSQRLMRAWEVLEATGRSLAEWQALPLQGGLNAPYLPIVLEPERDILYDAIDQRFRQMLAAGALAEVAALAAVDEALPAMKALGIPELRRHLAGTSALEQATVAAQRATRRYAKRQVTWFRHQMSGTPLRLREKFSESLWPKIFPIIRQFLLTG